MVPNLSMEERLHYLSQEIDRIQEMLEGTEDCKWVYQSLINLSFLYRNETNQWPEHVGFESCVDKLIELDPLRRRRWVDMRKLQ